MDDFSMLRLSRCFAPSEHPSTQRTSPYSQLDRRSDEIRLIRVLPANAEDPILCDITTFTLKDAPAYTALSYTWGQPGGRYNIHLSGHCIAIRDNLWRFLHEIRNQPRHHRRYFWIDALCIDQSNQKERTHQVGLMSRIYRGAWDVTVWLGPAYGNSEAAMRSFARKSSPTDLAKIWRRPGEASAICQLCERKYWSRLWVVQEIVLARDISLLCGSQQVRWTDFQSFMKISGSISMALPGEARPQYDLTMASSAARMIDQVLQARGEASLLQQVKASAKLGCSDARDKIYGVLGIVGSGHESILPDYSIGMSTLLNRVLKNEVMLNPPRRLPDVKKVCEELASALCVETEVIFDLDQESGENGIPNTQDLVTSPLFYQGISFWWASYYGLDVIQRLWLDSRGSQPLDEAFLSAARVGHEATCSFLLRTANGMFDINHANQDGQTALWFASRNGFRDVASLLLADHRSVINRRAADDTTALDSAIRLGHEEIALMLIDNEHTHLDYTSANYPSPLELAARFGRETTLRRLLRESKVQLLDMNNTSDTCKPLAAADGHHTIRGLLLERLAYTLGLGEGVCDHGLTAAEAFSQGYTPLTMQLLDILNSAEMRHPKLQPGPLLYEALKAGKELVALRILQTSELSERIAGCRTHSWNVSLNLAARQGQEAIVKALLDLPNLDVNLRTQTSGDGAYKTALEEAVHAKQVQTAKLLLKRPDVDVNMSSLAHEPLLHQVVSAGEQAILKLLLQRKDLEINQKGGSKSMSALERVIQRKDQGMLQLLLVRKDLDVNIRGLKDELILFIAMRADARLAEMLLGREDIDVNLHCCNACGDLPLIWTIHRNEKALTRLLLDKPNIDINSMGPNCQKGPPLWCAASNKRCWAVDLLLQKPGIEVNWQCCITGASVLSRAIHHGDQYMVERLLHTREVYVSRQDKYCMKYYYPTLYRDSQSYFRKKAPEGSMKRMLHYVLGEECAFEHDH